MRYNIISSGSQGNAVVIDDDILIDIGVPYKALADVKGQLKLVLLTHIHGDHINKTTLSRLVRERPTLRVGCCEWMKDVAAECEAKRIDVYDIGRRYNYGAFSLSPVKLYHNVPNCGYRLYRDDKKILYCTDTNTLDGISAKDYDLYMLECNYEDEEIRNRIASKAQRGEYAYEYNVLHNHLSKQKCDDFIVANAGGNSEFVYMHRHREVKDDDCNRTD